MIYCVEDDSNVREIELYTLHSTGFEAIGFSEGGAFWRALESQLPDLILLDVMLPGEDGIEILKKLKENRKWKNIPVIMATAKGAEYDKIQGLDLGADDYIVKPFGMMEMVSRVRAVLRRSEVKPTSSLLQVGEITLNNKGYEVTVSGKQVLLTLKEFELLRAMMESPGVVFTRDNLLDLVWGGAFYGETRTVDMHIKTLRQKLGSGAELIQTVRGVGYRIEVKNQ